MRKSAAPNSGFEVEIIGPLCLDSREPAALTWLARVGTCVVASVRLLWKEGQVGVIQDLDLREEAQHVRTTSRLLGTLAEFARERGILKLKVHRNSTHEWVGGLLSRHGYRDAAATKNSESTPMQFYLDLYHSNRRRGREDTPIEWVRKTIRLAV